MFGFMLLAREKIDKKSKVNSASFFFFLVFDQKAKNRKKELGTS